MKVESVILFLSFLFLFIQQSSSFSFLVAPGTEEIFVEDFPQGTPVTMMYQVIEGGHLDIDIRVTGPDGRIIYNAPKENSGKHTFITSQSGSHVFSFSNEMSSVTTKRVGLWLEWSTDEEPKISTSDFATAQNLQNMELLLNQLNAAISSIENDQGYLKMREKAHRNTNESTNERVVYWSIFEVFILLCMSFFQVYYLKRFFEVKISI